VAKRRRLAVRFDELVWSEAIRGFSGRPLQVATSARAQLERDGVALASLLPCAALGPDRTALAGCAKLYLPITDEPPSQRPLRVRDSAHPRYAGRVARLVVHRVRPPSPWRGHPQRLRTRTSTAPWPIPFVAASLTVSASVAQAPRVMRAPRPKRASPPSFRSGTRAASPVARGGGSVSAEGPARGRFVMSRIGDGGDRGPGPLGAQGSLDDAEQGRGQVARA
jgi:hypothetical protein